MSRRVPGIKKIGEKCARFLKLWTSGVREIGTLVRELDSHERTVRRWMMQYRNGQLDRHLPEGQKVQPAKPGLAVGLPLKSEQEQPDDPAAMNPPTHGKRVTIEAMNAAKQRKKGLKDDANYGKAPTKEELSDLLNEVYGPDFVPDPGPEWDPMAVARQAARDPRVRVSDRLKAVDICERRRQYDLLHGTAKGKVSWKDVVLADIPVDERARLFGLLAEQMQQARAPFLGAAETTPDQEAVYFAIGLQVHPDDAPRVLAELGPAREAAVGVAKALTEARKAPPADITPVDPQDYLDHVPE
jgi:hypothetical protein